MTAEPPRESSTVIRSWSGDLSRQDLDRDVHDLRSQVARGASASISTVDAALVAAAIVALDGWAREVHLVPADIDPEFGDDVVRLESLGAARSQDAGVVGDVATQWVLYTSGTTGTPKPISHRLSSLTRTVAANSAQTFTWGLTYDPNRMAGIQVILQALVGGGSFVAPPPQEPLARRLEFLAANRVDAMSATPSVWRQILQLPAGRQLGLHQVTLGGEIADQRILDALADTYPDARIVHVFASTETSSAFSVRDGRAGFPLSYLDEPPRGIRLEIRDGILFVHSPHASAAGDDGFASTGDVVEIDRDRVMFRGRASGVVNIGGSNVWPETVEELLRTHPDVAEAVVSAKANAMTGHVLVANVALQPHADADRVVKQLRSWVRDQAPRTHVPATITITEEVGVSATGKVQR